MCALVTGVQTFALPILITPLAGGFLAQSRDSGRIDPGALKVVTKRAPSEQELADMVFAFRVAKHVKSNAIVYARDGATVGLGAGPMSRVHYATVAAWKAREEAPGATRMAMRGERRESERKGRTR